MAEKITIWESMRQMWVMSFALRPLLSITQEPSVRIRYKVFVWVPEAASHKSSACRAAKGPSHFTDWVIPDSITRNFTISTHVTGFSNTRKFCKQNLVSSHRYYVCIRFTNERTIDRFVLLTEMAEVQHGIEEEMTVTSGNTVVLPCSSPKSCFDIRSVTLYQFMKQLENEHHLATQTISRVHNGLPATGSAAVSDKSTRTTSNSRFVLIHHSVWINTDVLLTVQALEWCGLPSRDPTWTYKTYTTLT